MDEDTRRSPQAWWLLVRRAFAVPDLIGDPFARQVVRNRMLEGLAAGFGSEEEATVASDATVDAVISLGANGGLEPFLTTIDDLDEAVELVQRASRVPGAAPLASRTLDAVKAYVDAHPFEDHSGRAFS
jgi:hypothetical protein